MFNQQLSLFGEIPVRNLFIQMKIVLAITLILLGSQLAFAATSSDPGLQMCGTSANTGGKFALCAASTCVPTGKTMAVNINGKGGGTTPFPSATCTCPIIDQTIMNLNTSASVPPNVPLQALAAVYEGNMKGTCDVTDPSTEVWSLFQPITNYPQATPAFSTSNNGPAAPQICANISGKQLGANCFSFKCTIIPGGTNGVATASCTCPLGEGPFGGATPPGSLFPTEAGGTVVDTAAKKAFCYMNPVSIPLDIVRQFINYP
jgi:hypothetical protein